MRESRSGLPRAPSTERETVLDVEGISLPALLAVPREPDGIVVFAHGSGSSRLSPRNRLVAAYLNQAGIATLLFDLLTDAEAADRRNVFDVELLAGRLEGATAELRNLPEFSRLALGFFGASTGAAAALWAAADLGADVAAVVSRGGRPDLAAPRLAEVTSPTLLVVGGADAVVLDLNRSVLTLFAGEAELRTVPGASHLFEEPGALETAAELARDWFARHLAAAR